MNNILGTKVGTEDECGWTTELQSGAPFHRFYSRVIMLTYEGFSLLNVNWIEQLPSRSTHDVYYMEPASHSEWRSMEVCEDLWRSADLVYIVFRLTQDLLMKARKNPGFKFLLSPSITPLMHLALNLPDSDVQAWIRSHEPAKPGPEKLGWGGWQPSLTSWKALFCQV